MISSNHDSFFQAKRKKGESGQITIDFIFALILTLGFFVLLFTMTFTLSVVEVAQYITFSTARAMSASNKDPTVQVEVARRKYSSLLGEGSPVRSLFQGGGWYSLSSPSELDIRSGFDKDFSADLGAGDDRGHVFTGVSTVFKANVLNLNVPFLGSTSDGEDGAFSTRINTILIRESSQKECLDWYKARQSALGTLPSGQSPYFSSEEVLLMEDNGC